MENMRYKKLYLTILCIMSMLFLSSCGTGKKAMTEAEIIDTLIEPTVRITVGNYRGTGVIIENDDEKITIASVAHLLTGYDQGIISFYSGKTGFADVFYCDEASDVCLLRISKEDMSEDFANSIKCNEVDVKHYDELEAGDTVYLVGSSVSVAGNIVKGTCEAKDYYVPEFDAYLMYLYCYAFEGMSGSGCYDVDGNLVGIVTGATDNGEVVCIPIKDFIDVIEGEN